MQKKIDAVNASKDASEQQIASLNDQIGSIQSLPAHAGQTTAQAKPTLDQTNQKVSELEQQLRDVKARMDLLPKKEESDQLEDLKRGLSGQHGLSKYDDPKKPRLQGKDFVIKGRRDAEDPSVIRLLTRGYMNPDADYAPNEAADSKASMGTTSSL